MSHLCNSSCHIARLHIALAKNFHRKEHPDTVAVKTWCRICALPVMLDVITDYDMAVRHFFSLDDTPMGHKDIHYENGGWGVNWRLDEVLATVFPHSHHVDNWPMCEWWLDSYGHPVAWDEEVVIVGDCDLAAHRDIRLEEELRTLAEVRRHEKLRDLQI